MMFRKYATVNALREGQSVVFEGVKFVMDGDGTITEGDLYVAERNTVKFLTAKKVDPDGYIIPTTSDYCFDTHECVKVKEA